MKLPAFLGGAVKEQEADDLQPQAKSQPGNVTISPEIMHTRASREKIDFHIKRFKLALEQCEKGPEREAELEKHLNYWLARRDFETLREGMN